MRLLVRVVPLVVAAMLAPTAAAKGPLQLCGASACATFASEMDFGRVLSDGPHQAPAAAQPYYRVVFADMTNGALAYWVPSAGVLRLDVRGRAAWVQPQPDVAAQLAAAAASLRPLRPPKLTSVVVDGREVRVPRGYLRLYSVGTPATGAPGADGWLRIWFTSAVTTPWTDGDNSLWISRRGAYVSRDGQLVRIPTAIARKVRALQPLA